MSLKHRSDSTMATVHVHNIAPDAVNRQEHDFYKTPAQAVDRFCKYWLERGSMFVGRALNPSCGDGAISEGLIRNKLFTRREVKSMDLIDRGYGRGGVDFLSAPLTTYAQSGTIENVITNPPFKVTVDGKQRAGLIAFARRAFRLRPIRVCLLGRLLLLEGHKNSTFFRETNLSRVLIYSPRVNIARNGDDWGDDGHGGMVAFAWYVWESDRRYDATEVDWI